MVPETISGSSTPELVEHLVHGKAGGLGIERVEHRLDQQHVGAAFDQPARLLGIGLRQLVEADVAEAGVVDVGRDRGRAVGGPQRAGDEARLVRRPLRRRVGRGARELGGGQVDLVGQRLHAVVGERDALGIEGVGADDIGAGRQIAVVDLGDRLGPGQHEQIVVALHGLAVAGKARPAEGRLVELVALDHRAHGAVDDEDALLRGRLQRGDALLAGLVMR